MAMLQGNTYSMPIKIRDNAGEVVRGEQVERGEFVFGEITKFYGVGGDVVWDESRDAFILPLTEEETFAFKGVVEYQGRVLLKDGSVSGSVPKGEYVYDSIGKTVLSDGGVGESDGEILTIELLERVVNTGITEEVDPTVPEYVKAISEQDIANWNKVNNLGNVFKYKGSVQTFGDLPTENNQVGDTYNVIEAYESYGAGTNFAWSDAGEWDALGGVGGTGGVSQEDFDKLVNNKKQIKSIDEPDLLRIGGGTSSSGATNRKGIAIGNGASVHTTGCVAIGKNAKTNNSYSMAIGDSASTDEYGVAVGGNAEAKAHYSVAIGYNAKAKYGGSSGATIQISSGTNSTPNTLQVQDDNIYNFDTHTLTVQNIELNGVNLGTQLGDLNTALESILGV